MNALRLVLTSALVIGASGAGLLRTSAAQTRPGATFVKDLGGGPHSSTPSSLTAIGGVVYFSACTSASGCELWTSNGTAEGTTLVKDMAAGSADALPSQFTAVNGTVFFTATDPQAGRELWKTDGTAVGTIRVKDIAPGATASLPFSLTSVGGLVFFTAEDASGRELWRSDGTEAGTVRVKDISPGPASGVAGPLTSVNGMLFFAASNGTTGEELWKSDGTEAGTVQVVDSTPGPGSSAPRSIVNVNGTLYFTQADPAAGRELWRSNGTAQGTALIKDIVPGPAGGTDALIVAGGTLFFMAQTPAHGSEWWRSDGTEGGTALIKDITPGPAGTVPVHARAHDGLLYFFTTYGFEGQQWKLWRSDGSESGTVILKEDLRSVRAFGASNQTLFFAASDSLLLTSVLWRIDNAGFNITRVKNDVGGIEFGSSASLNGLLLFHSSDQIHGTELWKTDGTDAGTGLVADINPARNTSIRAVTAGNAVTFLLAGTSGDSWKLWRTDGTSAGTAKVSDVAVPFLGTPELAHRAGTVFFAGQDASGIELWKSDGSASGTSLVKDVWPGAESNGRVRSSRPTTPVSLGNAVLFAAETENGRQLWKTDGTGTGTVPVFGPGASPFNGVSNLVLRTVLNNSVFFTEDSNGFFARLWKSDGTPGGTIQVFDQYTSGLTVVGNEMYFASGRSLYKTDGTPGGTVLVASLGAHANAEAPSSLTNVNGTLFFTHEGRLWKTDGVTTLRVPAGIGLRVTDQPQLAAVGGTLFLRATTVEAGTELWKTDGTLVGTVLVKDIRPGPEGSEPSSLTSSGTHVFFTADDGVHGRELWASDGTEAGTVLVRDIVPGYASSTPLDLAQSGQILFFTATDLVHGQQLWRATADGLLPTPADTDGDGLPNAWETNFGLNPQGPTGQDGAEGDPDTDGRTNLEEYEAGTHPKVAATLAADKTTLRFGAVGTVSAFSSQTAAQSVRLTQQGSGVLSWSIVAEQPWITITPASGSGPATVSVTVRPDPSVSFTGGTAAIRFMLAGSDRSFHDVAVTLNLMPAAGSTAPLGVVDTPIDHSTGVTGAVPFTGWAVDDLDVTRVAICRAAVGTEIAPVDGHCGGNRQIFVGFPTFVDGVRPDVQAYASAYPRNSRAGWGFLMLTNMLPNQGNGTYTFYAYAHDVEGHSTLLGTRTMTCDNAHATLPFGTIDTPTQGGSASGSTYVNFGWALTQNPKSIPVDGSTIMVYVDGVAVGTASYNHFRPDVAGAFPGLANSNGAVGFRVLDTTTLPDGLHTIAWTVVDSSGAMAGIGSRFFTVTNAGGGLRSRVTAKAAGATVDAPSAAHLDMVSAAALPYDQTPLFVRQGWNLDGPWSQFPIDPSGRVVIRGEELDRFELWLGTRLGDSQTGYLRTAAALAPLPAGSRLQQSDGTFTWAPGAGFVGAYDLVFVHWRDGRPVERREVRIMLAPKGSTR